ncbi:MAG: MarR family transcriptional regulator [Alphaproteobacteria bacterium]
MMKSLAKRAMTTTGQKACIVIDHLVEALGNEPSSSLRRAEILIDIDQHPGTTQTAIMDRLKINKSALNREIEWLFNYGCIMFQDDTKDGRAKKIHICGYSKKGLDAALDYCDGDHEKLKFFLQNTAKTLKQEKPSLRDAKIVAFLYERKQADKQALYNELYDGSPSTDGRALGKLIETGIVEDNA